MPDDLPVSRRPPLNTLRAFEAAARYNSFAAAAGELNVTAGAVSHMVKALEEQLQVALFTRHARGVDLTEDGREYAAAVGQSLNRLYEATARLIDRNREPTLRVCCYPTIAVHWLVPRWDRFLAAFPDIMLDVKTTFAPAPELLDTYDIIIGYDRDRYRCLPDGTVSERVLDVTSIPVCAPAFLADHPDAARLDRIHRQPLIHARLRHLDWDRWLASAGAGETVGQRGAMLESLTLAYNAAMSGAGIAIAVREFVAADIAAGRLVQPIDHARRSHSGFNMFHRETRMRMKPRFAAVLDWLRAESVLRANPDH